MSAILVLTVVISAVFILADKSGNDPLVTIHSCGEVVWTGRLNDITEEKILTIIPAANGEHPIVAEGIDTSHEHFNVVRISPDGVCVTDSDCKNRICIHQGMTASGDLPIACLPNKLLITVSSDEGADADAYTY